MEFVNTCSLYKILRKLRKLLTKRLSSFFKMITFTVGRYDASVSLNWKIGQSECRRLFVGAFANTYNSRLGLGGAKNDVVKLTIYVQFGAETPLAFLRKMNRAGTTWDFVFDIHQLLLVSETCKNETIGSVAVKAMRIGWRIEFSAMATLASPLFESMRFIFVFRKIKYEKVV